MRFQKLSENKLKIFLSNDELPSSKNLNDFMSNPNDARHAFLDILDKAYNEVGFNTKDYKIKIDAVALRNGDLVFTVTKLIKVGNDRKIAKPQKVAKSNKLSFAIYKFDKFDDFCDFCKYIKSVNISDIRSVAKKVELYLYSNNYYLSIININHNYRYLAKFYCSITEFCKYYSSKELFASVLHEKGELIIKNNAIASYLKNLT